MYPITLTLDSHIFKVEEITNGSGDSIFIAIGGSTSRKLYFLNASTMEETSLTIQAHSILYSCR